MKMKRLFIIVVSVLVSIGVIIGVIISVIVLIRGQGAPQANTSTTATVQAQLNGTATEQAQAIVTAQAQANATVTAQAQANATGTAEAQATATAAALPTIPPAKDCVYKYWSTGVNMQVTLTNFGVPTGCVLVSDSVQGKLTREDIANSTPIDWSQGGVMAFPEGVYSGFIYNGEYEIVPRTANPNPEQVFCNRLQQVVTNHYAFSQAQPLPEWGLPPGTQIVKQGHC